MTPTCNRASGSVFPLGVTNVTCAATDTFGLSTSGSFTVTVGYGFAGFAQPLNDPISSTNPASVFKGGSTVPVKFALTFANGSVISDTTAASIAAACRATITLTQTPGNAPPVDEVVTSVTANTGNCFRYDSTAHQFIYNLGTKTYPAPSLYLLRAVVVGPGNVVLVTHSLSMGLR